MFCPVGRMKFLQLGLKSFTLGNWKSLPLFQFPLVWAVSLWTIFLVRPSSSVSHSGTVSFETQADTVCKSRGTSLHPLKENMRNQKENRVRPVTWFIVKFPLRLYLICTDWSKRFTIVPSLPWCEVSCRIVFATQIPTAHGSWIPAREFLAWRIITWVVHENPNKMEEIDPVCMLLYDTKRKAYRDLRSGGLVMFLCAAHDACVERCM